ncbi:MAG: metal ABC transporter permease [Rhodocyclaceae bacterium]|nr:metal ABC transporter permease [Rhodocyclaceae bacterium]
MNWDLLVDPLFRLPFVTGLGLAIGLPLLGLYLRMRGEWLAVLGVAQLAALGALAASVFAVPGLIGAVLAGAGAVIAKRMGRGGGMGAYVLMLLIGWSLAVLLLANLPALEHVGQGLFDGQLYFAGSDHAIATFTVLVIGGALLQRQGRRLLLARVHPVLAQASTPILWAHWGFDLLVGVGVGVGILSLGVMAAFALTWLPAWAVFDRAQGWRQAQWRVVLIGGVGYVIAFVAALVADQPFGPVCVVGVLAAGWLARRMG